MLRILSTYLFVSKKLTPEILTQIAGAGFQAVEIFAARSHFDYATRQEVRTIAQVLADKMKLSPQQILKACKIGECSPR